MEAESDILYSGMAGCLPNLSFSEMSKHERMQLALRCEEARAGLCHCLSFIGDVLVVAAGRDKPEFLPVNLMQLGHGLTAISALLPTLTDLEQLIRAELRETKLLSV